MDKVITYSHAQLAFQMLTLQTKICACAQYHDEEYLCTIWYVPQ